jgi:hypothetical protein
MHELSGAACLGRPPSVSECPALVLSTDPCRCTLSLTQINDPRPAYASALVLSSQSVLCNLHCTYSVHIQRYFHHSRLHGPESSAPSSPPTYLVSARNTRASHLLRDPVRHWTAASKALPPVHHRSSGTRHPREMDAPDKFTIALARALTFLEELIPA